MTGSNIPPVSTGSAKPAASSGQVVQIVSLPEGLKNNARALRIEGEVVQQNKDGSTRIKTPQGDIDVTIRGRQLPQGTKVEVDIPVGSPPRNVTVRPAPVQPQQAATTQPPVADTPEYIPPPVQTPTAQTRPAQGQPTQTQTPTTTPPPANEQTSSPAPNTGSQTTRPATTTAEQPQQATQTQQQQAQSQLPPLPPLKPGTMVTLAPLPDSPDQTALPSGTPTQQGLQKPVLQTPASNIGNANATAPFVPKESGRLLNTMLQAVKSVLPENLITKASTVKPVLANTNTTIGQSLAAGISEQSLLQPIPALQAKIISVTLPSGEVLSLAPKEVAATGTSAITTQGQANIGVPQTGTTIPSAPVSNTPAAAVQNPTPTIQTATPHIVQAPQLDIMVSQVTPQNQPILSVPVNTAGTTQNFVLQAPPSTVPVGTQITLEPVLLPSANPVPSDALPAAPTNPSVLPPAWRAALPLLQPSTLWPVMDELFQTFYQATPQAAQILGRTIPSPANPQNFGASVMLFAAALKSGDIQGWLGDKKLDMVTKLGKGDLVSRLSSDTAGLRGNTDATATDWKSFPIPLLWQNEISKIMFHVRREPPEEENEQGEMGTRFVLDLSLSRMGEVQLDGMLRGQRLDLIVRTQMGVSEPMQDAMRKAYADALDGTNIYGELGFQGNRKGWEMILKQADLLKESI